MYASDNGVDFLKVAAFDTKGINKPQYLSEIELLNTNEKPFFSTAITNFYPKITAIKSETDEADYIQNNSDITILEETVVDITTYMSKEGVLNWNAP